MKPLGASDPAAIGSYRVLAELGQGGMGRVLLGAGPDGRLVAVKLVSTALVGDAEFRARFAREVEASRRVSGAYTAAVVEADPDAPVPWLASVFVPGPSLQQAVATAGPLPEESALRLAAGLATALLEIHRVGLVHRDLKPSNVLLTDDGPRVIDFGIAKAVDDPNSQLTHTGSLVGSPGFMSPEQIETGLAGAAGDVFSLGAVLAAACTGRSPFTGSSTLQTLNNVVGVRADLTALPARIRHIVERCLERDPAARPTPAQVLELARPIPPSPRPWSPGVHRMIAEQRAQVERVLAGQPPVPPVTAAELTAPVAMTRIQMKPVFDGSEGRAVERDEPVSASGSGYRWGTVIAASVAVAALTAAATMVFVNWNPEPTASGDPTSSSPVPVSSSSPAPSSASSTTTTTTTTSTPPPEPVKQDLWLYWNNDLQDNATCLNEGCLGAPGYAPAQLEAKVLTAPVEGTVPLRSLWSAERGDVVVCGTDECVAQQEVVGYAPLRVEGYVFPTQAPGTIPLRLYWHEGRGDNALCGSEKCVADQEAVGYVFIRDEGFAYPA
ncbi:MULTISPECIES: serine/threonine-protein kinase [Actinosynnema]|uniref:serine/threonine-protein kinase n=1 Tax=Actinosynnema TaxID=40566 RepID=UPI0020A5CF0B|nr:serine/threonine-protein kinase [Actinosynnema pretiosum]MCP2096500.1 Serine/threonine protein kinase [Actinosynnema pretiosum]